jgi:class 3 adenylate cyclase
MKLLLTILFSILGATGLLAQSASTLEAKLKKASSASDKMELKYELAKIYNESSSTRGKAARYAKEAYLAAKDKRDYFMLAQIGYLDGLIHERNRDALRAQTRYKTAKENAVKAGDKNLAKDILQQSAKLYSKSSKFKEAYYASREAMQLSGRATAGGGSDSKLFSDVVKLKTLNRELVKDKERLTNELYAIKGGKAPASTSDITIGDKTVLTREEAARQRERLAEIQEKEKQLQSLSNEKAEEQKKRARLERKYAALSKEDLKREALLTETKLENERASNFNKILGLAVGSLCVFAFLLFSRLASNRKSKKELEEKNALIEAEQKKADELLLNILPAPIAAELKAKGKAKAQKINDASVLFTDFKNFSGIAEKMSPVDLVDELDHCFKGFDYIIAEYPSIEKIKTIGDAYMCASGLNGKPHRADDLVNAALEMQAFLEEYKLDRQQRGRPFFEARIGIHSGPVVGGVVGFKKFAYDIWGDTVNLAARMETNSVAGKVNISSVTYQKVKHIFRCEHRGKISAKNLGEVDMYFVKQNEAATA